jgi:outer membrane lipoprotein-sorting protein
MRSRFFIWAAMTVALLVAACGGATGAGGDGTDPGDQALSEPADGEYADETALQAAIANLAELDSFTYDTEIGVYSLGEDYRTTISGVERPADGSRAYAATMNNGNAWSVVSVDGSFYADIGRGLELLDAREDGDAATDPNWGGTLVQNALGRHFDDFIVVANESIDGRPAVHYRLADDAVDDLIRSTDGGFESFSSDLWVDKEGGYLVRASFGRQPMPTRDFHPSLNEFHFEVSDVGCQCPITAP